MRVLVLCSLFWSVAVANASVSDWFDQLSSLQGKFTQHVLQNAQPSQVSEGELWFQKPLLFRADYTTPSPLQLVSDGNTFFHYDVDLMQVTTKPASELANEGLMQVLSGSTNLSEKYDVQAISNENVVPALQNFVSAATELWLLKPKNEDAATTQAIIAFKGDALLVIGAEDDLGTTVFEFHNASVNGAISPKRFLFDVPDGVDVLGTIDGNADSLGDDDMSNENLGSNKDK